MHTALEHARELVNSGAVIIGGQSTRPGANQLLIWEQEAERLQVYTGTIRSIVQKIVRRKGIFERVFFEDRVAETLFHK